MIRALRAEILKLRRSMMPVWTALVVMVAPWITISSVALSQGGAAAVKWSDFMRAGPQLIACWYGTLLFGMVTAYIFGRERAEGTEQQVLTLPLKRELILIAKGLLVVGWALTLTLLAIVVQVGYGALIGVHGSSWAGMVTYLGLALKVATLILATLPWTALLALVGRDYVAPMVFSALAAFLGLGFAEAGWGRWFPWSMPVSATGLTLLPAVPLPPLAGWSYAVLAVVFVTGCLGSMLYFGRADTA